MTKSVVIFHNFVNMPTNGCMSLTVLEMIQLLLSCGKNVGVLPGRVCGHSVRFLFLKVLSLSLNK